MQMQTDADPIFLLLRTRTEQLLILGQICGLAWGLKNFRIHTSLYTDCHVIVVSFWP